MQKLHPAVLELGLAYSDGTIVGSSARSIAMMLAMHCVVRDFKPSESQAFSRALTSYINACVGFLWDECRAACVPQRNSIKWLKSTINNVRPTACSRAADLDSDRCRDPTAEASARLDGLQQCVQVSPAEDDEVARHQIMKAMDNFINEKFIFAEKMVVQHACSKILEGDVIVTYGHSSIIESILLKAKQVCLSCHAMLLVLPC